MGEKMEKERIGANIKGKKFGSPSQKHKKREKKKKKRVQ